MSVRMAKLEHEVAYQDLLSLISKHADKISGEELLAIAGNMIGKLIGLQDQRTMSVERAMKIVIGNMEYGNKQVFEELLNKTKGNA